MKKHADPNEWFKCKYCKRYFRGADNFVRHKKEEHENIYWQGRLFQEETTLKETESRRINAPLSPMIDESEIRTSTTQKSCSCACKCRSNFKDEHDPEEIFFDFRDKDQPSRLRSEVKREYSGDPDIQCLGVVLSDDQPEATTRVMISPPREVRNQKPKSVKQFNFAPSSGYSSNSNNKVAPRGGSSKTTRHPPARTSSPENFDCLSEQFDDEEVFHPQQFNPRRHDLVSSPGNFDSFSIEDDEEVVRPEQFNPRRRDLVSPSRSSDRFSIEDDEEVVRPQQLNPRRHDLVSPTGSFDNFSIEDDEEVVRPRQSNSCIRDLVSPTSSFDRFSIEDDEEVVQSQQFSALRRRNDPMHPKVQDRYTARVTTDRRTAMMSSHVSSLRKSKDAHHLRNVQRLPSGPLPDFEVPCSSRNVPRTLLRKGYNFSSGHERPNRREKSISCRSFTVPTSHSLSPAIRFASNTSQAKSTHRQRHVSTDSNLELEVSIDPSEVWSSKIPDDNLIIEDFAPKPPNLDEFDQSIIDNSERISSSEAQSLNLPLNSPEPTDFNSETHSEIPDFVSVTPIKIRNISYLQSEAPVMPAVSHRIPNTLSKTGLELIMNSYDEGDDSSPAANPLTPSLHVQNPGKEQLSSLSLSETSVLPDKDTAVNKVQTIVNTESVRTAEPTILPTIGGTESVDGSIKTCLIFQTIDTVESSKPEDASTHLASTSRRREITFSIPEDADVLTVAKLLLEIAQLQRTGRKKDQGHSEQDSSSHKVNQESVGPEYKDTTPRVIAMANDDNNHQSLKNPINVQSESSASDLESSCHQDESKITESEATFPNPETLASTAETVPEPEAEPPHRAESEMSAASIIQETKPTDDSVESSSLESVSASVYFVPTTSISGHAEANSTPSPFSELVSPKSVPSTPEAFASDSSPGSDIPGTSLIESPSEPISTQESQSIPCVTTPSFSEPSPVLIKPTSSIPESLTLDPACISPLSESTTPAPEPLDLVPKTNGPIPADSGPHTKTTQLISSTSELLTSISQLMTINSSPTSPSKSRSQHPVQLNPVAAELDSNDSEEPPDPNICELGDLDSSLSDHDYNDSCSSEPSPAKGSSRSMSSRPSYWFDDIHREEVTHAHLKAIEKIMRVLDKESSPPSISKMSSALTISRNSCQTPQPPPFKNIPKSPTKASSQSDSSCTQLQEPTPPNKPAILSGIQLPQSFPSTLRLYDQAEQEVPSPDALLAPISKTHTDIYPSVSGPLMETKASKKLYSSSTVIEHCPQSDYNLPNSRASKQQHSQRNDFMETSGSHPNFIQSSPNDFNFTSTSPRPKRKCTEDITYRPNSPKQSKQRTQPSPNVQSPPPSSLQQSLGSESTLAPNPTFDITKTAVVDNNSLAQIDQTQFYVRFQRSDGQIGKPGAINQSSQGEGSTRKALTQIQPHSQTKQTTVVGETENCAKIEEPNNELEYSSQVEANEEESTSIEFPPAIVKPGVFRYYRRQERKLYKSQLAKSKSKGKRVPIPEAETVLDVPFPNISAYDATSWAWVYNCRIALYVEQVKNTLARPPGKCLQPKAKQSDPLPKHSKKNQSGQVLKQRGAKSLPSKVSKQPTNPKASGRGGRSNQELHSLKRRSRSKRPSRCTLPCCRSFAAEIQEDKCKKGKRANNIVRPHRRRPKEIFPHPPVLIKCETVETPPEDPTDLLSQPSSPPRNLPKLTQQIYPCRFCIMRFDNKQSSMDHEIEHLAEMPLKCRFCETSFPLSNLRDRHERISHADERNLPFADYIFFCIWCSSSFPDQLSLKRHEEQHAEVKPCLCGTCPPRPLNEQDCAEPDLNRCESNICTKCLRGAQRCTEVEVEDIPFHCRHCPVISPSVQARERHETRIHPPSQPGFPCSTCSKPYYSIIIRTLHERMH